MILGRVRITDLIDRDASSPRYCGHSIGRVIEAPSASGTQHVRVDRIERMGDTVYGIGPILDPAKAVVTQAKWDTRWGIRCAPVKIEPERKTKIPAMPTGGVRRTPIADIDAAAAAIVAEGYRALAKVHHPDAGGNHQAMALLSQAKQQLTQILQLARGGAQ